MAMITFYHACTAIVGGGEGGKIPSFWLEHSSTSISSKALQRLCICTGLSKLWLLVNAMSTMCQNLMQTFDAYCDYFVFHQFKHMFWHSGKSGTMRESNQASGVCKAHYL